MRIIPENCAQFNTQFASSVVLITLSALIFHSIKASECYICCELIETVCDVFCKMVFLLNSFNDFCFSFLSDAISPSLFLPFSRSIYRPWFNSSKRTVDFGLGRGLSGAIEAKHRLGMAAANFAGKFQTLLTWNPNIFSILILQLSLLCFCIYFVLFRRWTRPPTTIWERCLNAIQLKFLYKIMPKRDSMKSES